MVSWPDIKQKQWIKACKKLGLDVDTSSEKGSHARAYGNNLTNPLTIPYHSNKYISQSIYKNLRDAGFSDKEIMKALR